MAVDRPCCPRPSVLVVDDSRGVRDTLAELLAEEGYAVSTSDVASAPGMLNRSHVCYVLTVGELGKPFDLDRLLAVVQEHVGAPAAS